MPDFPTRLRKQLDEQWSNILIRRKSAEAILRLVEAVRAMPKSLLSGAAKEALKALDDE